MVDFDAYGKPTFGDAYDFPNDSNVLAAFADTFANVRRGTSTERQSLPSGQQRPGMLFSESDTGRVYRSNGAGAWTLVSSPDHAFAMAAGRHPGGSGFVTVNFPAGRFTVAPVVTVQVESGSGTAAGTAIRVNGVTKDSFTYATTVVSVPVMWQAVQMTPTAAEG